MQDLAKHVTSLKDLQNGSNSGEGMRKSNKLRSHCEKRGSQMPAAMILDTDRKLNAPVYSTSVKLDPASMMMMQQSRHRKGPCSGSWYSDSATSHTPWATLSTVTFASRAGIAQLHAHYLMRQHSRSSPIKCISTLQSSAKELFSPG